jgi:hypothetical protein
MSKANRLAVIPKVTAAVTSGKDSEIEAVFAQDFKMLIPGTGGREAKDMPLPPGIEGTCCLQWSTESQDPKRLLDPFTRRSAISNFIRWSRLRKMMAAKILLQVGMSSLVAPFSEKEVIVGIHTGEFMGVPATGKSIIGRFASFDKIIDGKIVSSEVFMDVTSLLIQIGAMEPPKGFWASGIQ